MLIIIKKTNSYDYSNENNDNSVHTIRTKKGTCDCA